MSPAPFQRARSEEQRATRRRVILETAAEMLADMPVADVSLNALSRRVCLAKSNVLRYFESREEILLELLDIESRSLLERLDGALPAVADAAAAPGERSDRLAALLAESLAGRPVLCDLISARATVLERNVSPGVAAAYRRSALANTEALACLARRCVPELTAQDALRFAGAGCMAAGSLWAYAQPSTAVRAALEADPSLAALRLDFTQSVREVLEVLLSGLLARSGRHGTS